MKTLVAIGVLFLLTSCSTCRVTSIEDAKYYQARGYPVRIAVYKVGTDGKIMGMGMWTHHAQAQVKVGDEWLWADGDTLSKRPTYTVDNDIHYWQPEIYEAYLKQNNTYN